MSTRSPLCRLARLQELDVSGNQIQTVVAVGRCGARLAALKKLNLGHNRLTSLPANLSAMAPNLEILLSRSGEDRDKTEVFTAVKSRFGILEILLLSHNEIVSPSFDVSYSSLSQLRHVDLAHNDFRRVRASDLAPLRSGTLVAEKLAAHPVVT